jgi:hypothetical protein
MRIYYNTSVHRLCGHGCWYYCQEAEWELEWDGDFPPGYPDSENEIKEWIKDQLGPNEQRKYWKTRDIVCSEGENHQRVTPQDYLPGIPPLRHHEHRVQYVRPQEVKKIVDKRTITELKPVDPPLLSFKPCLQPEICLATRAETPPCTITTACEHYTRFQGCWECISCGQRGNVGLQCMGLMTRKVKDEEYAVQPTMEWIQKPCEALCTAQCKQSSE